MFDFPDTPVEGDTTTNGEVIYRFDGTKWMVASGTAAGIPEAPTDGATYGRQSVAWAPVLPLAGGTLTGQLTLAGPPAGALDAATRQYVLDNSAAGVAGVSSFNGRTGAVSLGSTDISGASGLLTSGGTLTGTLTLAGNAAAALQPVPLQQMQASIPASSDLLPFTDGVAAPGSALTWSRGDHVHPTDTTRAALSDLSGYLPLYGGALSGGLGFGSANASTPDNLARHLALYGTTYGLDVTANNLNYVAPSGAAHTLRVANTTVAQVNAAGLSVTGAVTASGTVTAAGVQSTGVTTMQAGSGANNALRLTPAASGSAPTLSVVGDTNVGININTAGSGVVTVNSAIVLPADPTTDPQAATKHYVDSKTAGSGSGGGTVSAPSVSQTLTAASTRSQSFAFTAPYLTVTLPDATTLQEGGPLFSLTNSGGHPFGIMRADASFLVSVAPGDTASLWLDDNATAAGVWHATGAALEYAREVGVGFLTLGTGTPTLMSCIGRVAIHQSGQTLQAFDTATMTVGATVTLAANPVGLVTLLPVDSTRGIVVYYTSGTLRAQLLTVTAPATLALGTSVNATDLTPSTILGAVAVTSTTFFVGYGVSGNNAGIMLSLSGSTLTWGAGVSCACTASSLQVYGLGRFIVVDSSRVLIVFGGTSAANNVQVMSVSGTTLTANAGVQLSATANITGRVSTNLFIIGVGGGTYALTLSGATVTLGSVLALGQNVNNILPITATSMFVGGLYTATQSFLAYVTISGTTQTNVSGAMVIPGTYNGAGTLLPPGGTSYQVATMFPLSTTNVFHPTVGTLGLVGGVVQSIQRDPFANVTLDYGQGYILDVSGTCAMLGLDSGAGSSTRANVAALRYSNGLYTRATTAACVGFVASASGPGGLPGEFVLGTVAASGGTWTLKRCALWQVAT